jgi:hypothetical protein
MGWATCRPVEDPEPYFFAAAALWQTCRRKIPVSKQENSFEGILGRLEGMDRRKTPRRSVRSSLGKWGDLRVEVQIGS